MAVATAQMPIATLQPQTRVSGSALKRSSSMVQCAKPVQHVIRRLMRTPGLGVGRLITVVYVMTRSAAGATTSTLTHAHNASPTRLDMQWTARVTRSTSTMMQITSASHAMHTVTSASVLGSSFVPRVKLGRLNRRMLRSAMSSVPLSTMPPQRHAHSTEMARP